MPTRLRQAALFAALSLCAPLRADDDDIESTPAPPRVEAGVILRGPTSGRWFEVDTGCGETSYFTTGDPTVITWHLDARVTLLASDLRPGVRIRFLCPFSVAERIEVVGLGPLAMEAAVEEFVADACGGRLGRGLSAPELAAVEALGSPSHLVREAVSRAIAARGPKALRVLVWARRHGDPEVKARAEALLGSLGWERPGGDPPAGSP